jgi:hypothetical protein
VGERLYLTEKECAIVYRTIFRTMGKISIHEFMKAMKNTLSIEIVIEGAKLILDRISYKVS